MESTVVDVEQDSKIVELFTTENQVMGAQIEDKQGEVILPTFIDSKMGPYNVSYGGSGLAVVAFYWYRLGKGGEG
jgi:N-acetylglucosamine-6-phosphate deacetylase